MFTLSTKFYKKFIAKKCHIGYNIGKLILGEIIMDKDMEFEDDTCDLDPTKICDNCEKCLELDKNYKVIKITKIITNNENGKE